MQANMPTAKHFIERILAEKTAQEAVSQNLRTIFAEARDAGFDRVALTKAVSAIRQRKKAEKRNQLDLFETQLAQIGSYVTNYYEGEKAA